MIQSWLICHFSFLVKLYFLVSIGGSLESPEWLFLVFCPKIVGGGGDLQIVILLKKKCSFSGADNVRLWGHSSTTRW